MRLEIYIAGANAQRAATPTAFGVPPVLLISIPFFENLDSSYISSLYLMEK